MSSGSEPRHAVRIVNTQEDYGCAASRTLLGGMEALGRRGIPAGCRGGGCGICKVRIETGTVRTDRMSRAHVSVDEEARGYVLACRAYPTSDVVLRAVDKLARCIERRPAEPAPSPFLTGALHRVPPTP